MYQPYYPLFLKKGKRLIPYNPFDIMFIEAADDFVKIATAGKKDLFNYTMAALEEELCEKIFIRVHRSYIVNLQYVIYIENGLINLGAVEIPIHKNYSANFFKQLWLVRPS